MTNPSNRRVKAAWSAGKYVRVFQDALEHYETEHPHWKVEVLVSMIRWGLRGAQRQGDNLGIAFRRTALCRRLGLEGTARWRCYPEQACVRENYKAEHLHCRGGP